MIRLLVGVVLALTAVNVTAGKMYIYKDKSGKVLLTSVNPSGESDKFTKKVTSYKDNTLSSSNNIAQKKKIYTASEVSKKIGKKLSTSEVVAMPSTQKYISPSNKTHIQTDKSIQNNVSKYYKPKDWPQSYKENFEYLKSTEDVQAIESNDLEKVYNSMQANGYSLLGSSEFNDRSLPKSIFISQAKKLGATHVFIYKIGTSELPYSIDDDLNDLDYAYYYVSDFYVKDNYYKNPGMLGVRMDEIPLDKRNLFQRNTGGYITNVTKGSRAYFANIILGDVVIAINGKEVRFAEELNTIKDSELKVSKDLNLTIIRLINDVPTRIQIPVSFN